MFADKSDQFAFAVHGRPRHSRLRVCFALLAGLAPLHGERVAARAGEGPAPDPGVFYETSSYGPEAIGAVARAVGSGALVHGSDRPYAPPPRSGLDDRAPELQEANPAAAGKPAQAAAAGSSFAFLALPAVWLCFAFFFFTTVGMSAVQSFASPAMQVVSPSCIMVGEVWNSPTI